MTRSAEKVVRATIFSPGNSLINRPVASIPSMIGIWTSISTTSGRVSRTSVMASAPFSASPTSSKPSDDSRKTRSAARTSDSSSTIITRMESVTSPSYGPSGRALAERI